MIGDILARVEGRLEAVRLSATAASKAAGLSADAIRNMRRAAEKDDGSRQGVSTATITALAPILQTTVEWLLEGRGPQEVEARQVPLVGYVGAGDAAHYYDMGQGPFGYVDAPEGSGPHTVAGEVKGGSIGRFFDGWLIFWDDVHSPVTPDQHGELCVIGLPDGRVLVKWLQAARDGRFHLLSQSEDPMFDQEVAWAAKVTNMRPR